MASYSIINILQAQKNNDSKGLYLYTGNTSTQPSFLSYSQLYQKARAIAAGYKSAGFKYNDILLLYVGRAIKLIYNDKSDYIIF